MYEQHFGLTKNPFSMTPEPALVYMTPGHREALAGLAYAILERKGFAMLTGEAGTGKSTLLARMLHHLPAQPRGFQRDSQPHPDRIGVPRTGHAGFRLRLGAGQQGPAAGAFAGFSVARAAGREDRRAGDRRGPQAGAAVLEEVRLLSNLELPGEKLLQIVLAGQDELLELLRRTEMRQISQRISVRLALVAAGAGGYRTVHRAAVGEGRRARRRRPSPPDAYSEIALWSRGIPRLVNALCDNAVMTAFSEKPPWWPRAMSAKRRGTWD